MKIAQFIASQGYGGAERLFVALCNELAKSEDVTAITFDNPVIIRHLNSSVKVITLPTAVRYSPRLMWHLFKAIKSSEFDVVHTHCGKASEIVYQLSRLMGVHQVATKHNPRKGRVFNRIRWVTAVSKGVADSIRKATTVIHNGITPVTCQPSDEPKNPLQLLAIGRLDPIKAFDVLIQQVARLRIDFHLSIVGDGPHKTTIRAMIKMLRMEDKVSLLGFRDDIPRLMSEADLTVISSHSEGFSLVAAESMFYAKVMLSTRVGITVDLLSDEFLCEQDQLAMAIERIAADYTAYRHNFKTIQLANRERFNITTTALAYLDFYKKSLIEPVS